MLFGQPRRHNQCFSRGLRVRAAGCALDVCFVRRKRNALTSVRVHAVPAIALPIGRSGRAVQTDGHVAGSLSKTRSLQREMGARPPCTSMAVLVDLDDGQGGRMDRVVRVVSGRGLPLQSRPR